jgi:hypothetical protein
VEWRQKQRQQTTEIMQDGKVVRCQAGDDPGVEEAKGILGKLRVRFASQAGQPNDDDGVEGGLMALFVDADDEEDHNGDLKVSFTEPGSLGLTLKPSPTGTAQVADVSTQRLPGFQFCAASGLST